MAQIVQIPPHRRHGAVYRTKQYHGPLTRHAKLRVAHAPRMPGSCSPPSRVSDPDMHHGTCVTHVPWCMSESLISGFLWSQSRGKSSRHSRRMRNPQFYASGKRPMALLTWRYKRQWNVALNIPVAAPEGLGSNQKDKKEHDLQTVCVDSHQTLCLKQRWYHLDPKMILSSSVLSQILMRKFTGSSMVFGWRLPLTISNSISPGMLPSTTSSSSKQGITQHINIL